LAPAEILGFLEDDDDPDASPAPFSRLRFLLFFSRRRRVSSDSLSLESLLSPLSDDESDEAMDSSSSALPPLLEREGLRDRERRFLRRFFSFFFRFFSRSFSFSRSRSLSFFFFLDFFLFGRGYTGGQG
jgi:hypothetical protein